MTQYTRTSSEDWEAQGKAMGLDKPLIVQYLIWVGNAVRGDFGKLRLLPAQLFGDDSGIHAGDVAAIGDFVHIRRAAGGTVRRAVGGQAQHGLGLRRAQLRAAGAVRPAVLDSHCACADIQRSARPAAHLAARRLAALRSAYSHARLAARRRALRLTRSSMLEVLDSEFVKLARAKGVASNSIVWKHAFRNAMITPLTFALILLAGFLNGTVVVETVFAWPGIGRLAVNAALNTDFPLVTGLALVFGFIFLFASLCADILYGVLDPRIRYE